MGAGASDTGKDKELKGKQEDPEEKRPKQLNYVPICDPPHYDLRFDSTDSEITELEQQRERRKSDPLPIPIALPYPVTRRQSSRRVSDDLSLIEEVVEEQRTITAEEQTPLPESVLEEQPRVLVPAIEGIEEESESARAGRESRESRESGKSRKSRHDQEGQEDQEDQEYQVDPQNPEDITGGQRKDRRPREKSISVRGKQRPCGLNDTCTNLDLCRLRRCQRQVSFGKGVDYYRKASDRKRQELSLTSIEDTDRSLVEYCECSGNDERIDTSRSSCERYCSLNRVSESEELDEEEDEEVMLDYQRYSREQPEKDPSTGKKAPGVGNMRDCCHACCPNRTASLKHNNASGGNNACRCRSQGKQGNRHISESYVSCRGSCSTPPHSKSVPNQLDDRNSYQCYQEVGNNRSFAARRSPSRPQPPPRKNKPRTYPQASDFEARASVERPHIPLPPPQHFNSDQQVTPAYQNSESRNSEDHEDRKEMYNHNTSRNYAVKPFHRGYNRQPMKPYPYEEPGASASYQDSSCSNNCSGYDHCPMHHGCRCQCLCSDDTHYGPLGQSDDQLSFCSDSSNSECMNLAYQRTGDYPELMDELETTLSHRNRMRVQKTMQRFEMLSRQNKNLEKPIFEDEESVRQYNMGKHRDKRDGECKCRNCEEKQRRQNYNSRSEVLAKRPNYQPTPFPRNSGYVEKVARYMDPNLNHREGTGRKKMDDRHDMGATMTNSNGTWQMDARKNEWVKVDPSGSRSSGSQNQYDFENSYPPLPPRPVSEHMYERRNFGHERGPCSCPKCLRRR